MFALIITKAFLKRFKSFSKIDKWKRDRYIVLQNNFFEIAVVDNEWSVAWCLLEREDVCEPSNRALMRRHYEVYLEAIKRILIKGWGEAIGYGGAWIAGKTYNMKDIVLPCRKKLKRIAK